MAELSGFEVLGVLKEIEEALRGAYINNVYRMGPSQLFRFRKPDAGDVWLVVSPKKGVWVSKEVTEKAETTEFTSKLRAELERSRFVEASQLDLDRVFVLNFQGKEGRKLIVELLPPGNIIVTDPDDRVLLALQDVRTPARMVARGHQYRPPMQTRVSPAGIRADEVERVLAKEKTVGSALGRHIGLPRKYVSECLARLGLDDASPSSSLKGREQDVARTLAEMIAEARERPSPCICETPKGDDLFVFAPKRLKVKKSAGTLSELCDLLLLPEAATEPEAETPEERKRREMEVTISRLRSEAASLRDEALKVRAAAERAGTSPLKDAVRILQESGVTPRELPSSPDAAASLLFDRSKKLRAKSEVAVESAEKLEKRLPKVRHEETSRRKPLRKRKQEWYEKFRWFFTSEGKLAVGGRDAQTNSALINRYLEDGDTVYHADLFGSPFFILKKGTAQSDAEVRQAAQATVAFSSAWKTGLGAADAYWVNKDQVRTAAPSGEYLARGSFAITGKKNFVSKTIVEVAVGIDPEGRVLAGPEDAVRVQTPRYLVLRPQKEKGSDTAKRVAKDLGSLGDGAALPDLDEVLRVLPVGGGKVIRRGGSAPRAP